MSEKNILGITWVMVGIAHSLRVHRVAEPMLEILGWMGVPGQGAQAPS